ncbi:MAG: DUF4430 domain-containing protein, partial [Eubacteriales bacterium]|nr:DUF4430 domain-containing protein [Eubacteriales bacterium]
GTVSDVDVTAMAVQALALYYDTENDVKAVVDKALIFLSEKQLDGGDYSGYGTPNPESTSQVIIALASLGIDPVEDSRFIKNGNGLIDGLLKYRLPDGSFSHTENGAFNHTSTVQAFCSLVALKRYFSGYDAFYTLDKTQNGSDDVSEPSETPSQAEASDSHAISSDESEHISVSVDISAELSVPDATDTTNYKIWASLSVSAVLIIICFVLWLMKKRRIKNYILPIMLGIIAVLIIILTDFQSKGDYYGDTASKTDVIGTVTLTVRCDTIAAEGNAEYIPSDGVILPVTIFDIANGDSVYDILIEAARKYGIQVENKGSKAAGMVYISAIGYIYEYDFGDLAGWMYRVNGVFPSTDCGGYILSDGDIIEWLYTKNLGDDLK